MGKLYLVGLGLYDERDLTLRAVDILRNVDEVYAEFYTSKPPGLDVKRLEKLLGKQIKIIPRETVESDFLIKTALTKNIALLVGGDPLSATTHVALIVEAKKRGVEYEVIHNASVFTAVPTACGLSVYKFGRTTTLPYPYKGVIFESPYEIIKENLSRGLHTLVLLDINPETGTSMSINEAIELLIMIEDKRKDGVITPDRLLVGVVNAGSKTQRVKAGYPKDLLHYNFDNGLHSLIVVGDLHFSEAEALVYLADAPKDILDNI